MTPLTERDAVEVPRLSVIVPAFNEEGVVGHTLRHLASVVAQHAPLAGRTEFVVVSDGSPDGTFDEAVEALRDGVAGTVVQLVRNVGSHTALRCGLHHARGDVVTFFSADGQDPAEALPEMLEALAGDIDIVWGERRKRADPFTTRLAARSFYAVFRVLTGLRYPRGGLDFVLFTRRVKDALLDHRERNAPLFLVLYNLGYGACTVPYDRRPRTRGESRWTTSKKLRLALDMVTSFSPAPLRFVSGLGAVTGLLGFVYGGVTVGRALLGRVPVEGWASLMVVGSVMGGLALVTLGFLGEYVWRILEEVRRRPFFLEDRIERIPAAVARPVDRSREETA